jgi:hypothetical protein
MTPIARGTNGNLNGNRFREPNDDTRSQSVPAIGNRFREWFPPQFPAVPVGSGPFRITKNRTLPEPVPGTGSRGSRPQFPLVPIGSGPSVVPEVPPLRGGNRELRPGRFSAG